MPASSSNSAHANHKAATTASIVLAFLSVYLFWGSTYTAIRIGAAQMPPLLFAGARFLAAGFILLGWCHWRGRRLTWPLKTMVMLGSIGLLLLGAGNVFVIYAERTVPSGFSSLVFAVIPLYVACIEMVLPSGEPLPSRGWLGLLLGFAGLAALLWPSLNTGLGGNRILLLAILALFAGAFCWTVGSVLSRHAHLKVDTFVAASWQMVIAGAVDLVAGTALGEWPQFHLNATSIGSLAYLVTAGSLLGYTSFIYLLEHVPVAKVMSYTYVNPVVAVLLGIILLHERLVAAEFAGMGCIVLAVFLMTTAQVKAKHGALPIEDLEQMPAE